MNELNAQKYSDIIFDTALCKLYADIISQDEDNLKVLSCIVKFKKINKHVTVKTITENVQIMRRVAVKDTSTGLVRYVNKLDYIDRKKAERLVQRLAYASLIYYDVQRPYKYIELTIRGLQVLKYIKQKEK